MNAEPSARLIDIDWQPSTRKLRQFAASLAAILVLLSWFSATVWVALCAIVVLTLSCFWPHVVKPLYIGTMIVTLPIGIVVGELALIAIFLGVFLPIGCLFRLLRRDALQRKLDRGAVSYWQDHQSASDRKSYLRRY